MAPLTFFSPAAHLTLLHSPNSPASEYALEALQLACQRFEVRRTMPFGPPLDAHELRELAGRLVGDPVDALVRRGAQYRALGLDLDHADLDTVVETLVAHPALLQTPILDDGRCAMIGHSVEHCDAWAVTGHVVAPRPASAAA